MLALGGVVVACLLVATLRVCEPCVVFFFGSGDFGMCCGFPFVHGAQNFVSVQSFAVDSLAQALSEVYNGSFSIEGPTSSEGEGKSFKGGDVGVDVPSSHGEFHELVIRILFLGRVHPGILERHFELCPEYFVIFTYVIGLGGVCACY